MTFAQIWDLAFTAFEIFVGVGIIWLLFIEPRLPSRELSVPLMIVVAILTAAASSYRGWRKARRDWLATQKQLEEVEAAAIQYESEVG
jgi:hypothetical protein